MQIQSSHLGLRKVVSIKMLMKEPTCNSKFSAHRCPLLPSSLHPLTLLPFSSWVFLGPSGPMALASECLGSSLEEARARSSSPSQKQLERG